MEMLNEKWDLRLIGMARFVSKWSKDPSTQTGAVLVRPDRSVISVGYNGFAQGVEDTDERYQNRYDLKYRMVIHCEENALIFGDRQSIIGSCLYTWPFISCSRCAAKMIRSGVKRVVSKQLEHIDNTAYNDPNRWEYEMRLAETQFKEAGVEVVLYPSEMFKDE